MRNALKLLRKLPYGLRDPMIRRMIEYPATIPQDLEFKIASTEEELEQAFRLLYSAYLSENLMKPNASEMRVTKFHALPTTSTLIAVHQGQVVGTLSLVRKSSFGLPCQSIFDLSVLPAEARVAEVSSLAIRKDFLHQRGRILFPLLKFLYHYATEYFAISHFVIAVSPRWFDFYRSVLRFQKLSERKVKNYQFVNGAEAVGGWLDLHEAQFEYHKIYSKLPAHRDLFRFFKKVEPDNMYFPLRGAGVVTDPVMTPDLFRSFFMEKTRLIDSLSEDELLLLKGIYDHEEYKKVLPQPKLVSLARRRAKRFDVRFQGRLVRSEAPPIRLWVNSISRVGFGGEFESQDIAEGIHQIDLNTEDTGPVRLTAEVVWVRENGQFGVRIRGVQNSDWVRLIERLDTRLLGAQESAPVSAGVNHKIL